MEPEGSLSCHTSSSLVPISARSIQSALLFTVVSHEPVTGPYPLPGQSSQHSYSMSCHTNPSLVPILYQVNPVSTLIQCRVTRARHSSLSPPGQSNPHYLTYLFNTNFNITFPSAFKSFKWSFSFSFFRSNFVITHISPCVLHSPPTSILLYAIMMQGPTGLVLVKCLALKLRSLYYKGAGLAQAI
jgi:hypothetical protein